MSVDVPRDECPPRHVVSQPVIHVGDALRHVRTLPSESVDLTLFSPPYDGVRDYKGEWAIDLPALGGELLRVTRGGGFAVIVIGDGTKDFRKSMTTFRTAVAWEDAGWGLFECAIYARDGRPGAWWATRFRVDHEYILMFFKGRRPRSLQKEHLRVPTKHRGKMWTGTQRLTNGETVPIASTVGDTKCRGTIWHYTTSNSEGNPLKMRHPATYPDALARDIVLAFSAPGDLVYDPFVGSGTTAVVAAQEGRRFLGCDISEEYVQIAHERLAREAGIVPLICSSCGSDEATAANAYCLDRLEEAV